MVSLVTPSNGDDVTAESVAQLTELWGGLRNIPTTHIINDNTAYAETIKNTGTGGRDLIIYAPDGVTVLLQVDSAGVKLSAAGGAAVAPATLAGAETLTNKTLSSAIVNDSDPPTATGQLLSRSLAKGWAYVTVTAGVPALTLGFNVSSIVDNGVGDLTINWSRVFSATGPVVATCQDMVAAHASAPGNASVRVRAYTMNTAVLTDPANYSVVAFGIN